MPVDERPSRNLVVVDSQHSSRSDLIGSSGNGGFDKLLLAEVRRPGDGSVAFSFEDFGDSWDGSGERDEVSSDDDQAVLLWLVGKGNASKTRSISSSSTRKRRQKAVQLTSSSIHLTTDPASRSITQL